MKSYINENGQHVDSYDTSGRYGGKYTGLEPFSQLSACLSRTGAKRGQAHLENSFLSLVTSAFLLKE